MGRKFRIIALRISVTYAVVAGLWIILSDRALALFVPSGWLNLLFQTYKGWAFVIVTASLLYVTLRNRLKTWEEESLGRRDAETALQEQEKRYRTLVHNLATGVIIVDTEENITFANPAGERLFAGREMSLVGMNLHDFMSDEEFSHIRSETGRRSRGETSTYEIEVQRLDGQIRYVQVTASPQYDTAGRFAGALATFHDITDKTILEQRVEEEKVQLRTLINNLPDGVYLKDRQSRFILANRAVVEMLGARDLESIIGKTDHAFYPPETADEFLADEWAVMDSATPLYDKLTSREAAGKLRWTLTTKVPIVGSDGVVRGLVGLIHDITERKAADEERQRLQEQLQAAQKMEAVGRLAGGIAHDFNNLLTVINGYCELALARPRGGDSLRSDLEEIKRASRRAATLTSQLLAFSRRQILQPKVIHLGELMAGMAEMLQRLLGEDIEITMYCAEGLWNVRADPGRIEQVVMNLAVNSRDAMPDGGKLTIETMNTVLDEGYTREHLEVRKGEYVLLAVSDTGVGMEATIQERIFEPFFTTKEKGKGTGLGLATVYGIVKQSDGYVFCYSEPGRGTTFKIYFPRVVEERDKQARPDQGSGSAPRGTERILLVEDDDAVRRITVSILENGGYEVVAEKNGVDAMKAVAGPDAEPDLLVTDVVMPGMDGKEVARAISEKFPAVRVLFISGYTENAIVHHGVLEEGVEFIPKPFTAMELLQKVRSLLDTHRQAAGC